MKSIASQLNESGIKIQNPADLIPEQLSDFPKAIQEAAKEGYIQGVAFRRTKKKESPYDHETREYKFFNLAFDFGMKDSKR